MPQRTGPQTTLTLGIGSITPRDTFILRQNIASAQEWSDKLKKMRRHPTISFLRKMLVAPMLAADWSIVTGTAKKDLKDIKTQVYNDLIGLRDAYIRDTIRGLMDWGWQPFELLHGYRDDSWTVKRMKPLLQRYTEILIDHQGTPVGLRNTLPNGSDAVQFASPLPWTDLFWGECAIITHDVEGDDHYGEPMMFAVETPFDSWEKTEIGARRFDEKVAGAHWVISYPQGTSPYNGVETDNATIARELGKALKANGIVTIPANVQRFVDDLNNIDPTKQGWKIELISAQTQQSMFIDRQRYCDSLFARGFGFPERAILEGQFGTKAEAEAHSDFAVDYLEMVHRSIVGKFNQSVTGFYLAVNWGEEYRKAVEFQARPLNDNQRAMLRQMYQQRLQDQGGGAAIEDEVVDWDVIRDELRIPVKRSVDTSYVAAQVAAEREAAAADQRPDEPPGDGSESLSN